MGCAMVDQILNIFEPYPNIKAIVSTCANNGYDSDMDQIVAVDSWHLLATQGAVSRVFCQQAQCGPANIEGTSAGKTPILGITQRWRVAETNGNHTQPRLGKCFAANYCPNPVFGVPCSCSKNCSYLPILMFGCIDLGLKPNMWRIFADMKFWNVSCCN